MAFVNLNNKEMNIAFTKKGNESWLKNGLLETLTYFTMSDDGIIYTSEVLPTQLVGINGSNVFVTGKITGCKFKIKE